MNRTFHGADSELWYRRKQKLAVVRYLMAVSDIREKQRKFYFVTVNSNTPRDQAESTTSCYRVTVLYIHALDTVLYLYLYVRTDSTPRKTDTLLLSTH